MMQISISNVIGSRSKSAPTLGEFISVWDTSLGDGVPSITLPLVASGNYNFSVNWGDGNTDTITAWNQAEVIHTYATNGVYTIIITGTIEGWSFAGGQDCEKITSITNIGPLKLGNEGTYFYGCSNLTTIGGTFDLTGTTNFSSMFESCTSLTSVNGIESWNISAATNIDYMFAYTSFNQDISGWDVSNVTNMEGVFYGASSFNQDISGWDVSAVTNMGGMFYQATSFNQDISAWDVSNVTDMGGMFDGAAAFNQDISGWDVSAVTAMNNMFANATSFNQPLNSWDVSNVTDMNYMFGEATSFNQPLNSWDVSAVTNMGYMFYNATSFNQPLNSWDVSFVTAMNGMFANATSFNQDISGWNTSAVINMASMFEGTIAFNQDISGWDVSNVTDMNYMFGDATAAFNQPLNSWNVSAVTNMGYMFYNATSFNQDISGWDVSSVTDMNAFMYGKTTADYSYYDNLLNAWSQLTLQNGVTWDMGSIEYTSVGSAARASIISNYSWTINDGGLLLDPDAQAFITAASITDSTQQSAINQLVVDLKGYSIWTKMKALYPFVGGTAATHKWNLKDPRDLDAAFRLVFSGGWTHSSTGALPNGTNAYADTFFNQTTNFTSTSNASIGVYLRTNNASTGADMGAGDTGSARQGMLIFSSFGGTYYGCAMGDTFIAPAPTNNDSRGFYSVVRNAGVQSLHKRGNITLNVSETEAVGSVTNETIWVGGGTSGGYNFSSRETAFNFIGDALSQTEINNLYTAVQAFQTTLGRSIGTQTVSDADAQAFVTNAGIVDQVEANAVNNLVIGLKADGLWSKMQAIYPFVGGTATTHKFNLKNPLDTNAAFRLVFSGGWTHSSNGATPNGTNAYADSFYNPNTNLASVNSAHLSYYSRTNATGGIEMGGGPVPLLDLSLNYSGAGGSNCWSMASFVTHYNLDSRCFMINSRTASNSFKVIKNGSVLVSSTGAAGATKPNANLYLGKRNYDNLWSTKECAFASIGDGLTDTDATNLNSRVTTFQTALNRNV